ncbi:hypothetical protein CALVIDRAFT_553560 [Calocera viscosa TUFC12733]|uniref:Cryptic loci regulator 2 N-terminal domain-containing protein n=1 Tax=Calocera viscosa (strain TUFC12733) TaxID=1330018 RepID=A0A167PYB3_CALVF|nr:hypothetical protein CALVIDRAFT_553560 [Calocera viscosa TUFC12733]
MSEEAGSSTSQTAIDGAVTRGENAQNVDFVLRFPRTDAGNPPRRPANVDPTVVGGMVNYHKPLEPNDPKSVNWRKTIGMHIAEHVLGRTGDDLKQYIIADFPEGYVFYSHLKGSVDAPRTDPYLYGSQTVSKFRSSKEFLPHAAWLFRSAEAESETCQCIYCSGALKEKNNQRVKARGLDSPEKPKSSPGGPSVPKRRGRPSKAAALDSSPHPDSSMGPKHPSSASPVKKSAKPTGGLIRSVEPERHTDLAYWEKRRYRENELVWAVLDPPIQGPKPWQRIELWPGLVKRQRGDLENDVDIKHVVPSCLIMFLAAQQVEHVAMVDIAPFLAYAVPGEFFNWLMCQGLPAEFRDDMDRIDRFQPLASKVEPVVPLAPPTPPTFGDAWPSYVLALQLAGDIFQKWSVSDPYDADRQWYLDFRLTPPRRFREPGEAYTAKFVDFTLLQGMYLGAERIWQNDLVRLNTPWANLQGISREPTPGSATRGLFYEIRWILRKQVSKDDREIITEGRLYELVPENTPDDIDIVKEEPIAPVAAPVVPVAPFAPAAPVGPILPAALPVAPEPLNSVVPLDPVVSTNTSEANQIASTEINGSALSAETNGAVVSAGTAAVGPDPSAETNGANQNSTDQPIEPAHDAMDVDHVPVHAPDAMEVDSVPMNGTSSQSTPQAGTVARRTMKRLLLAQPPLKGKDGQPTFDYPLPQAPPGFKFRCLHRDGTIGVTVGPLAIAGRYYRHLLVESSRLQMILGDPARNGIGSDQLQSLAGSLPGQLCAMMPVDYMYRGRAMTFVEAEQAAKNTLAERWGVNVDGFMHRFLIRDQVKRKLEDVSAV